MATGIIPSNVLEGSRLGCMTALRKPEGGDIIGGTHDREADCQTSRRSISPASACILHENRVCSILKPPLRSSTELVYTIQYENRDVRMENAERVLQFTRLFCGSTSIYIWENELGVSQDIALMLCFSIWGNIAHTKPLQGDPNRGKDCLHALMTGTLACSPANVSEVHAILSQELEYHAHIRLHLGPCPHPTASGEDANQQGDSNQMPWFGEKMHNCCLENQGVRILGTPIGRPKYVEDF